MEPLSTRGQNPPPRRVRAAALAALGVSAMALTGWFGFQRALAFVPASEASTIVDFDVFRLVGRLVVEGRLPEAYAASTLQALEGRMSLDVVRSIPFAYPPPFALALAALAPFPPSIAYALFEGLGLAMLVACLRGSSPPHFWPVMLATMPAVFINVIVGQNGMLTAGLAGIAAGLAAGGRSGAAGALAGLLGALKPQSCVALPLLFAGRRDWRAAGAMAAAGAAAVTLSVAVLGPAILPAFLSALSETSAFLAQGRFPLHRMTSVYAFVRSLGASADLSMAVHVATALAVLGTVALAARREDPRVASGLAMVGACFVSPYFYDYDLTIAGLGTAMVVPALAGAGRRWCGVACLCLLASAEGAGLVETLALPTRVSWGAPALLAGLLVMLAALANRAGGAATALRPPAAAVPA